MSTNLTFRAGEAGAISDMLPLMQRDLRRRGIIPDIEGKRARFSLRDVAGFTLVRAAKESGCSLQDASRFAEAFSPNLAEMVTERLRGSESRKRSIAAAGKLLDGSPVFHPVEDLSALEHEMPAGAVSSVFVLNLRPIATRMAEKISEVLAARAEMADLDRRLAALDADIAARGD